MDIKQQKYFCCFKACIHYNNKIYYSRFTNKEFILTNSEFLLSKLNNIKIKINLKGQK